MKMIFAIPITLVMVYRAWSKATLTHAGIVAAILTAGAHAIHPWNVPFGLLITFFIAGTRVTKIKYHIKSKLTIQASGDIGKESPRTHIQVFANSGVASVLSMLHAYQLIHREENYCHSWPGNLLFTGIVANYAAVAADTFSSELGILSKSQPRLITSLTLRKVPPGTNGGVTFFGLVAALLGSSIIVIASILLTPFCQSSIPINERDGSRTWTFSDKLRFSIAMIIWGAMGSVVDSFLGGWLQQSVIDTRSGKIVEGNGGKKVIVEILKYNVLEERLLRDGSLKRDRLSEAPDSSSHYFDGDSSTKTDKFNEEGSSISSKSLEMKPSRVVESGSLAWLDNNEVNFVMALTMSIGAMIIASLTLQVPLSSLLP
ncbi:Transmembrane protein 19 [Erysiphe neolycopersici]|uniref:Transmembrane protein 19 n=1 Tax=Erysiphe neolycopersici TaxID=212602 RepID=A0A420I3C3_9PEZI|nr:Transmembrane protein 19 [Erysiphe neolycopersici]